MPRAGTIRWNISAFREIRQSPGVRALLEEQVGRVLSTVGDVDGAEYAGGVEPGRTRARGYVVTVSPDAMEDEVEDHTLLRAIGGLS